MRHPTPSYAHWILGLRAIWYVVALVAINTLIISLGNGYTRLATVCFEEVCAADRLTLEGLAALQSLGLSAEFYAAYNTVLIIAVALIYVGVAALIFWTRPHDLAALLVSLTLLTVGVFMSEYVEAVRELHEWGRFVVDFMSVTGYVLFIVVCCTFPDGRFVPRWTRWPVLLWAAIIIPYYSLIDPEWAMESMLSFILALIYIGALVACFGIQLYRYRRVSSPLQRQQSRWVTYGLLQLVVIVIVVGFSGALWFPEMEISGTWPNLFTTLLEALSLMIVPITIGASILRYRLWNSNVLLNRTLVYVPLTTLLAGLYSVIMAISQKLFVGLTGQKSDAAVVLTGFILTVTFTPLRNSLQSLVDRQFKEAPDPMKKLRAFDDQVQYVAEIIDPFRIARRLVETAILAYKARGGAIYLCRYGELQLIYSSGNWQAGPRDINLPIKDGNGEVIGLLYLGCQEDGTVYNAPERQALRRTIAQVAHVLRVTDPAIGAMHADNEQQPDQAGNSTTVWPSLLTKIPQGSPPSLTPNFTSLPSKRRMG